MRPWVFWALAAAGLAACDPAGLAPERADLRVWSDTAGPYSVGYPRDWIPGLAKRRALAEDTIFEQVFAPIRTDLPVEMKVSVDRYAYGRAPGQDTYLKAYFARLAVPTPATVDIEDTLWTEMGGVPAFACRYSQWNAGKPLLRVLDFICWRGDRILTLEFDGDPSEVLARLGLAAQVAASVSFPAGTGGP